MMFATLPSVTPDIDAESELARGERLALSVIDAARDTNNTAPLVAIVREIMLGGRVGPFEAGFMARMITRALAGSRN